MTKWPNLQPTEGEAMLLMMLCGLWSRLMYGPRLTQAVMRCRVTGQEAVADYPVAMLN